MQKNTKEWIQYGSAVGMLVSGVALTFLCFFLNHYKVEDSVLLYVAQCLVYAGSIFGVAIYIHSKFGEVRSDIQQWLSKKETEKDDNECKLQSN